MCPPKDIRGSEVPHRQNAKRKWGRVLKGIFAYSCLYRASRCSHFPLHEGNLGKNKHYKSSIKDWDRFLWPLRRWQDSHLLLINQELHFPCDKEILPEKQKDSFGVSFPLKCWPQRWNTPAEQLHPDCLTPNDVLISAELQSGESWKLWILSGRQKAQIKGQ